MTIDGLHGKIGLRLKKITCCMKTLVKIETCLLHSDYVCRMDYICESFLQQSNPAHAHKTLHALHRNL